MKSDFTKLSYDPTKHYSGVRMQQGRVQLDADWNEQTDIQANLFQYLAQDFIGSSAYPAGTVAAPLNGFQITVDSDQMVRITPGRLYAGGLLCQLEGQPQSPVAFTAQPDYPG